MAIQLNCFDCNAKLSFVDGISRKDECDGCGADVRVCKNCRFYDSTAYNECRESQADPVKEKERSNFCDYFEAGSGAGGSKSREALKEAADALFKK